jgi:hypothetical protein
MQEENQNPSDSWQQPAAPTQSGLPYQPVMPEEAAEPQLEPSDPMTPDFNNPTDDVIDQPAAMPQATEDEALLRWQATEYVDHDRTTGWYVMLGVICLILVVVAVLLMKSWTFALLIPVMAVALVVYTRRPPALLNYTLSRKGLYVNDHLYTYDTFRGFSVVNHGNQHVANLIPRKRFQMAQTVYFPEEVGEPLVDMLAARMPMQEAKPDIFDRIIARLRM